MNTDTSKSSISSCLEQLRKLTAKQKRALSDATAAEADAESFENQIADMGTPSYRNEAKIRELTVLKTKLEYCREEIPQMQADLKAAIQELRSYLCGEVDGLVRSILQPVMDNRLATLVAVLRPFSRSQESAERIARTTDCWLSAFGSFCAVLPSCSSFLYPHQVVPAGEKCEAVLAEALKKSPDLMQFLDLGPAANAEASKAPISAAK